LVEGAVVVVVVAVEYLEGSVAAEHLDEEGLEVETDGLGFAYVAGTPWDAPRLSWGRT
jgi:hypothetical protein